MMIAFLYDLVYMIPLALVGILLGGSYFGIPDDRMTGLIVAVLMILWIAGIRHTEKRIKIGLLGLTLVVGFVAIKQMEPEERLLFIDEYIWLLWVLVFVVLAVILGILMEKFSIIGIFTGVLLTGYMTLLLISNGSSHRMTDGESVFGKMSVAVYFFIVAVIVIEQLQKKWKKSGYTDKKSHVVNVSPFILLMCMAIYLIPVSEKAYDWAWALKLWDRASTGIENITGALFYSEDYGITGFSDENGFVGSLSDKESDVMNVTFTAYSPNVLYMSGKVFDTFNGRSWTNSLGYGSVERQLDMYETMYAVQKYDRKYARDYFVETSVTVENLLLNTKTAWIPSKVNLIKSQFADMTLEDVEGAIKSLNRIKKTASYDLYFLRVNRDQPIFAEFVDKAETLERKDWYQKDATYTYDDYLRYKVTVREKYSGNYNLSPEVKELLDRLFEGVESDFEKMLRLEKYLESMKYTYTPGALPDYVNSPETFLDYFLLEKREGYCVHFATAFVLVARAYGIPARFVQGYRVQKGSDAKVLVTSRSAHAWSEVYLENVGWIQFEPTPGNSISNGWAVTDRDFVYEQPTDIYGNKHEDSVPDVTEKSETEEDAMNLMPVIVPLLVGLLFVMAFVAVSKMISRKNYDKLDDEGKLRTLSKQNFKYLKKIGFNVEEGETLAEFAGRIRRYYIEKLDEQNDRTELQKSMDIQVEEKKSSEIVKFIPVYEEVIYSDSKVTEEMLAKCLESSKYITELLKKKSIWLRLWIMLR